MQVSEAYSPYGKKPKLKSPKPAKEPHERPAHHGPLYNLSEASNYLSIAESTIRDLVREKKLGRFLGPGRTDKTFRTLLFAQSELDRFINANY